MRATVGGENLYIDSINYTRLLWVYYSTISTFCTCTCVKSAKVDIEFATIYIPLKLGIISEKKEKKVKTLAGLQDFKAASRFKDLVSTLSRRQQFTHLQKVPMKAEVLDML